MRKLAKAPIIVLLLFLFAATPSSAEIKYKKIRSDDRSQILFDTFKFTNSGHVSIAVSSVSVKFLPVTSNISRPDPSRFGFFLLSEEAKYGYYRERISCDLDSKFISLIFTFSNTSFNTFNESYSYPVTYPNDYSLYFANCNDLTHVSMDVRTELYNMVDNGSMKDYLSAAMTKLPRFYFIFSLIYLCFLAIWIFSCVINHKSVHIVHLLMGVLLVSKAIYLLSAFEVEHSVKVTGSRSHDQWYIYVLLYVFQFITFALLYTVIAIIFDGWSFSEPKAKRNLILVIPLQALSTVVTIVCHQSASPFSRLGLMVVDVIWLAIMAPIIIGSVCIVSDNEQAARNYKANSIQFRFSLIMVGVYLLINWYLGGMNKLFQSNKWETYEADEIITLVFYILMFLLFMPFERNKYFVQLYEAKAVRDVGVEL